MPISRKPPLTLLGLMAMLLFMSLPPGASSDVLGIYGVEKELPVSLQDSLEAVFIPAKEELVAAHVRTGRSVFLTLNVFGGSSGWRNYPDARPVRADGEYLDPALGGICPTHEGWRRNRLELLKSWLEKYRGDSAVAGIWLDYIRYPGRWEQRHPEIPDTCYCPRCLDTFQADSGITIGSEAKTVAEKAGWIRANARLPWMAWKKEQVVSFAGEVKRLMGQAGEGRLLLGAFVVPWRKSDYEGAISYHLAQDAQLLAAHVEVFSPMVYHRMVGRPVSWIGEVTDYYAGMTGREVWPIIQAEKVEEEEFARAVQDVSRRSAQGMLVYRLSDMQEEHWRQLGKYREPPNLLPNPRLEKLAGKAGESIAVPESDRPLDWFSPPLEDLEDSRFLYEDRDGGNAIGLVAGSDRRAVWSAELPDCRPGASYLFSAEFLRPDRLDVLAYPEIELWGRSYRLNTHRMTVNFQKLQAIVQCPEQYRPDERLFRFRNDYPGNTFWMRLPVLTEMPPSAQGATTAPEPDFFPIGAYGANSGNLNEIRGLGMNTAVIDMTEDNIDACLAIGLRCTLAVPRDPVKLIDALDRLKPKLTRGRFSFYVNDEPEIHSFPAAEAEDIQQIIKQNFPEAVTNMAIVRPQGIPFYEKAADFFMLDQYPVPNMPMTWLSDSMDEAAGYVGRARLQSVIQAFGDDKHAPGGWPRLPTFEEMRCLAFLSVVHGSRGIYFYTFPSIAATSQGREDLARLVGQLNSIKPWLDHNEGEPVSLEMTSENRFDPRGNSAVHCAGKERHNTRMLICVNTIGTYTEAEIDIPADRQRYWRDYFSDRPYMVVDGNILSRFEPYEVKVLLESK